MLELLRESIQAGRLGITDPDGQRHVLRGPTAGPEASIRITDKRLLRRMLVVPDLYLGEAFIEGTLTVEEDTLYDLLDFFAVNLMPRAHDSRAVVLPNTYQADVIGKAQANVQFHYDLNRALFELFLDRDLQYSCAYFANDRESLEEAQSNKKKRVAAKLLLQPGMRVLDIGSGFGGLALHLASEFGVDVVGVTLSDEQWRVSQERAAAAGLDHKVTFKLLDYREESGRYDRIVSVGMFEHVGASH
jgi:cyclopropane-fatty-acyl-phospholipid synthase